MQMDTRRLFPSFVSICIFIVVSACSGASPTAAPEQPNTPLSTASLAALVEPSPTLSVFVPATLPPTDTPVPTITPVPPCTNNLAFLADATIPDGTLVAAGSSVDKQWRVKNTGTCSWDIGYRFRPLMGADLGVGEQALYPARAGTEIVLRIVFTAPQVLGVYSSTWQAVAPDGSPFGDIVTVSIIVQ